MNPEESLEKVVANLVQKVERRFYGKYRGFVKDNKDPKKLGRLKLQIPSLLGKEVVTGWATPCVPYGGDKNQGFLFIPEIDAGVWVEFEEGDLEFPIWVGTFWSEPEEEKKSEMPKPNKADGTEEDNVQGSEEEPPTCKMIKTKHGHTIQFEDAKDDKKDEEDRVTIIEATHNHLITMDKEGIKITAGTTNNILEMKSKEDEESVTITEGKHKHVITMDKDGIEITDGAKKNKIEMKKNAFNITSKVPFKIDASGQSIEITGDTIDFKKG